MKIPKSFKLLSKTLKVRYANDLMISRAISGYANFFDDVIVLQRSVDGVTLSNTNVEVTFLHELVHHILESMGEMEICNNERFVDLFARLLHQYLETARYGKD